jgi:hypothetical protein
LVIVHDFILRGGGEEEEEREREKEKTASIFSLS